jgi:hypothetical protein
MARREPKNRLTDANLRSRRPAQRGSRYMVIDGAVAGFAVRIGDREPEANGPCKAGSVTFVLIARYPGSKNPCARRIGEYAPASELEPLDPKMDIEAGPFSLERARAVARRWKDEIKRGVDPQEKRRNDKAEKMAAEARRQAGTFRAAFDAYEIDHLSRLRTGATVAGVVRKHVLPIFGDKPLESIPHFEINMFVKNIKNKTKLVVTANRIVSYLKHFGRWAEDQALVDRSPFAKLKKPTGEEEFQRDRVLSKMEIKAIWEACAEAGPFGRAVRMLLVTAQRRSEVGEWFGRRLTTTMLYG